MADKRRIEIFSAGCPVCRELEAQVRAEACPSCEIVVSDMQMLDGRGENSGGGGGYEPDRGEPGQPPHDSGGQSTQGADEDDDLPF